ncbi:hypothetical protein ACFQX8_28010 [Klenkia terrae]|uniref:hypothetical protein n=1 Tax=Klenkia terrae TaxID=1052259 RepID=UPI0036063E49
MDPATLIGVGIALVAILASMIMEGSSPWPSSCSRRSSWSSRARSAQPWPA